jgi:hypothetical protein
VAHLADIRDKRYKLAVTAAMGRDFDGIIVKDGGLRCCVARARFGPWTAALQQQRAACAQEGKCGQGLGGCWLRR